MSRSLTPIAYLEPAQAPAPVAPPQVKPGRQVTSALRKPVILVVDDEQLIADSLAEILNASGYAATAVYSGAAAVDCVGQLKPDVLISDILMPRLNGVEAAIRIAQISRKTRILLFSGQARTVDLLSSARSAGLEFGLLPKPIHPEQLLTTVAALLHS